MDNSPFADTPKETPLQLRRIAKADCDRRYGTLDFGDALTRDIGIFVVLGLMRKGMTPLAWDGSLAIPVQRVAEGARLREFTGMKPFPELPTERNDRQFKLRSRNPGLPIAKPAKAVVSLGNYIEW